MKKLGGILIVCIALFAALTTAAKAADAPLTKEQAVINEARRVYSACQYTAGRRSFAGYCGLMTSHQLYNMGINESLIVWGGNQQFDYYKGMDKTTGGHYIKAYPAPDYTLKEALNTITNGGTRDAYNLLIGFQWTNTEAGRKYGHACVINAILDGTVYFTESFYTSIGGAEGNVSQCSIDKFAEYFGSWTVFEGVIDFGTGQYADLCETYETNIYVRTRFASTLRSQPCLVGKNDCKQMRSLQSGELLLVSAVCKEPDSNMLYYRVEDGEGQGYVAAGAVSIVQYNGGNLEGKNIQMPDFLETGKPLSIKGNVAARKAMIGDLEVIVSDFTGNVVLQAQQPVNGYTCGFMVINAQMAEQGLNEGIYRVQIFGEAACNIVNGTQLDIGYVRELVCEQALEVGEKPKGEKTQLLPPSEQSQTVADGWVLENGIWHCYQQGQARTGWVEELGVRYYLDETGAVTTGWANVEGMKLYFSPTGALCTGWLATKDGTVYLQQYGGLAQGWQTIQGYKYFFDESNFLVTEGIQRYNGVRHEIQPDGRAIPIEE